MIDFRKFSLGISQLLPQWKKIFSSKYLINDLTAGVTVAFIAVPLSLAIALASGVSPGVGLITAIIAGIVCALFGGTALGVSGPAAAMSILIADIVQKFGVPSLILICCLAGIMQLISGMAGLGKLSRYVPLPVIAGFTAGIGVIILIGQLPRAFGLAPPAQSDIFSVFSHLKLYLHEINGTCVFLVFLTIGLIQGIPKVFSKAPAILLAVVITSLITYFFDLSEVPLIGAIPDSLPMPHFPTSFTMTFQELVLNAFIIFSLASLETLLSSSAIDKLIKTEKHDPDQELIGQGLGNIAVSFFGGIPVTGVIARSVANVRAGAKTRRASIIHSILIFVTILALAPLISAIPIAALAGVLFSIAFSMINYKEFYSLWKNARSEAIIYGSTFLSIIFVDLLAGVQAGIITACLIVLIRSTKTHFHITFNAKDDVVRVSFSGALTFLSTRKIADLQKEFGDKYYGQTIIIDFSNIRNLDMSGASAIIELFEYCQSKHIPIFMRGFPRRFEQIFKLSGGSVLLEKYYLMTENELHNRTDIKVPKSSYGRLIHGVQRFYRQSQHDDKRLFEYLSQKQNPHTLFITCSDSRIIPSLITSADPGELFIIRNIGNYIPPHFVDNYYSEAAAIEFALGNFDITEIVVCGHANCGAMRACQLSNHTSLALELASWINKIKAQLPDTAPLNLDQLACRNVMNQINNLKSYPMVQKKIQAKELNLHAWFYNFEENLVYESTHHEMNFKMIASDLAAAG